MQENGYLPAVAGDDQLCKVVEVQRYKKVSNYWLYPYTGDEDAVTMNVVQEESVKYQVTKKVQFKFFCVGSPS